MNDNGSEPAASWILATCAPNTDFAVSERLERRGFVHYVFRVRAQHVRRGKIIDAFRPAFPRYLFAQIPDERWMEFFEQVEGVCGFVRNGDNGPAHIASDIIGGLLARAPNGVLPEEPKRCPFARGERVIVRGAGLVAGYFGIFQHPVDGEHAVIEQEWLGRSVSVKVRLDELAKAERKNKRRRRRRHGRASQAS